jgi:FkbM family methyltransferase
LFASPHNGGFVKLINALPFPIQFAVANSKILALATGTKYWGLQDLDKKLIAIIGNKPGFFVELGANDGISQSNTKHLEMFHGWRGVLIEPYPGNFQKLSKTRSSSTHFVNAACVSFGFQKSEMELTYSNLMTTPMEGSSDVEDRESHAQSGKKFLKGNERVSTFSAKARTLNSILDDAGAPSVIDLLSLDVEGGELEVLSGVDHSKYRFNWILAESRNKQKISDFLEKLGYAFHSQLTGHDFLFQDKVRQP